MGVADVAFNSYMTDQLCVLQMNESQFSSIYESYTYVPTNVRVHSENRLIFRRSYPIIFTRGDTSSGFGEIQSIRVARVR